MPRSKATLGTAKGSEIGLDGKMQKADIAKSSEVEDVPVVLDVAGGSGELACQLMLAQIPSVIIDPRPPNWRRTLGMRAICKMMTFQLRTCLFVVWRSFRRLNLPKLLLWSLNSNNVSNSLWISCC